MAIKTKQVYLSRGIHPPSVRADVRQFVWHFVQMVLAMMVGMGVYHLLTGKSLAAYPVLNFAGMELSMVPPMIALMRYHRYSWQRTWEMAAVMLTGPVVFIACAQLGLHTYIPGLSIKTLFSLGDLSMYLGMLGIMFYRRAEYTTGHAGHQHANSSQAEPTEHTPREPYENNQQDQACHAS